MATFLSSIVWTAIHYHRNRDEFLTSQSKIGFFFSGISTPPAMIHLLLNM